MSEMKERTRRQGREVGSRRRIADDDECVRRPIFSQTAKVLDLFCTQVEARLAKAKENQFIMDWMSRKLGINIMEFRNSEFYPDFERTRYQKCISYCLRLRDGKRSAH